MISTLACNHQNWPEERTFANFIEVIKNILGCSFGTVLRHSRVLEPNKEKMDPGMVAEYKAQLEQLGRIDELRSKKCTINLIKSQFSEILVVIHL